MIWKWLISSTLIHLFKTLWRFCQLLSVYPNLKLSVTTLPHPLLMKNRKLSAYFFSRSHSLPFYWLPVCALSHWEAFLNVTLKKSSNNSLLFFASVTGSFLLHWRSITLHSLCRLGKTFFYPQLHLELAISERLITTLNCLCAVREKDKLLFIAKGWKTKGKWKDSLSRILM